MPLDYSKWDKLELSDDSDIEVHPNVDKKSFIRAKQNQIHQEREQRKHHITTLKYERLINDGLISRISNLLASLKSHAADVESKAKSPAEVAFAAVMESAASMKQEDDQPPPRPAGVHGSEEPLPTYSKMMVTLLDQVNKSMEEKKVTDDQRYGAMVKEVEEHLDKVTTMQGELYKKLAELEKEEGRKITSEGIHEGFNSSHVNKAKPKEETKVELLNPSAGTPKAEASSSVSKDPEDDEDDEDDDDDDDDEMKASPMARKFADITIGNFSQSHSLLSAHPEILAEKDSDGILVMAFDAQLDGRDDFARQCVHQALLLQYCRTLGRDGVDIFFKRITTKGHQAQDVFYKDVQDTYLKIKTRAREINIERAQEGHSEGVEQIQLHAVEPGTVINIQVPPKDSEDPAEQGARKIFDGFKPEMRTALESGSLDKVNEVLGRMKVEEAEELVGLFNDANVLSLEDQIIDATNDDGKAQWKQLQDQVAANTEESQYADDPE